MTSPSQRSTPSPASPAAVTIRDVAQAAGVHVSTVSRALDPNRRQLISAEVLKQVEAAARRLGYRPNRTASALRTGRSNFIGVLLPDITNSVFPPILEGIEASASARHYFMLIANVRDAANGKAVLERLLAQQVAGLIMATVTRDDPLVEFVTATGLPTVLVNRADDSGRLGAVVSDDRLAMKFAVDHLAQLGHTHIAHLAGPQLSPTGLGRRQGFEQALRDRDLPPGQIVECTAYSREAGRVAMQQLLSSAPRPQAVVCCNDLVALGAYDVMHAAGLRVPEDISITGHNDMPLVDLVAPPLTTVRLPHRELGWRAAEMMFDLILGKPGLASTVVLRPELVIRASTAARPA
ncbi:LacI family DNA-binding transcriptional regulator [Hydrogenophaga laconesensis]|uniref:LacI family transcriptional regulator n=1 Tax=Hydrogenophaga laconesensis TaxID=1805971 RepID=A0ABU1VC21_9BURK|nr:LacI family DNA-binding transcriptional regulator [Hydrogenophaga laconesensis]MDR7094935.1 LacI family transcriptional regulator [Hydrogenophaga laconesensis]